MDRFSNLPDDVAHKIISFLALEDTSRLSVASKRCRQLCLSNSFLNFDISPYVRYPIQRAELMDYIDRLLFLRRGTDAQYCCILGYLLIGEEFRVLSWLNNAVALNVKYFFLVLTLEGGSQCLTLPSSLLCSTAVETLIVSFCYFGTGILKTPSLRATSSLQLLKLKSVRIDESFGNWISSHCKFLKKLQLEHIEGTTRLIITSSSLEELVILSPRGSLLHLHVSAEILRLLILVWRFDSPNDRELRLSTPKLKILYWKGNILNLSVAENMTDLLLSKVFLKPFSGEAYANQNLIHAIRAVSDSIGLALYNHSVQDLLKLGCPRILFTNLLALRIWIKDTEVGCVTIRSGKLEDIPFLINLKFVTVDVITQENNELELIEFLLKNAQNLKKMTVFSSYDLQPDFIREISGYEKASSDAVVNFMMI
ncbi:hypothetical protein TIFTF001_024968 [Ficus carica]|uniref:F-box domain-containing protein n=1 Tax=Ficus carica TaxID=3494 RepID=A0AA88AIW6_FICCA|nr:hypothetical protein TIFTF001_024968 [Ficus carica]